MVVGAMGPALNSNRFRGRRFRFQVNYHGLEALGPGSISIHIVLGPSTYNPSVFKRFRALGSDPIYGVPTRVCLQMGPVLRRANPMTAQSPRKFSLTVQFGSHTCQPPKRINIPNKLASKTGLADRLDSCRVQLSGQVSFQASQLPRQASFPDIAESQIC